MKITTSVEKLSLCLFVFSWLAASRRIDGDHGLTACANFGLLTTHHRDVKHPLLMNESSSHKHCFVLRSFQAWLGRAILLKRVQDRVSSRPRAACPRCASRRAKKSSKFRESHSKFSKGCDHARRTRTKAERRAANFLHGRLQSGHNDRANVHILLQTLILAKIKIGNTGFPCNLFKNPGQNIQPRHGVQTIIVATLAQGAILVRTLFFEAV